MECALHTFTLGPTK